MTKRQVWSVIIPGALVLAAISGGVGYYIAGNYYQALLSSVHIVHDTNTAYSLISPLINVTIPKEASGETFTPILNKLKASFSSQPAGSLKRYSVYFRDLTNGHWTGIHENDQYSPASMLKVVAAIAAYKQNEDRPGFIQSRLTYTQALANINTEIPDALPVKLVVGTSYPVPFLIKEMLGDSDNGAKDLLLNAIDDTELNDVYQDLTVPLPGADTSRYTISALDYSRFFRILYNATYLSRADSNSILQYLSQATYTDGLVAGVPSGVPVAHKYGERVLSTGAAQDVELHDCGIVYHARHPYFLCVMTEGSDPSALATIIASASRVVYQEVDADYK